MKSIDQKKYIQDSEHEVETKWRASSVSRQEFLNFIEDQKYTSGNDFFTHKKAIGPDYYYRSPDGSVLRHRVGADTEEVTVKTRTGSADTTVRREHELKLKPGANLQASIPSFFSLLGIEFEFDVMVHKDCEISFFKEDDIIVHIVWYEVTCKGFENEFYMEIEAEGDHSDPNILTKKLKALKKWSKVLKDQFGLTDEDECDLALYEIYSGKRYKVA